MKNIWKTLRCIFRVHLDRSKQVLSIEKMLSIYKCRDEGQILEFVDNLHDFNESLLG